MNFVNRIVNTKGLHDDAVVHLPEACEAVGEVHADLYVDSIL